MAPQHNGISVLELAARIRKEQKAPYFAYGMTYAPAHWAKRMNKTITEFVAMSDVDKIQWIAVTIVDDAIEYVANNPDKLGSTATRVDTSQAEIDEFMQSMTGMTTRAGG